MKLKFKFNKLIKFSKGFNLIELIVVIAIISILSITSFLILTKWIGKSRNSKRLSDLNKIKKVLTINYTQHGIYPYPSNKAGIKYSGDTLWEQGIFGKKTLNGIDEITKVPEDPLSNTGYDYSITKDQKTYQISAAMEIIDLVYTGMKKYLNKTYANDYYSKIIGNYDNLSLGIKTGNNCYTLSIPSIILSNFTGSAINLKTNSNKKYNFVLERGKNIGASYRKKISKNQKGVKFGIKNIYKNVKYLIGKISTFSLLDCIWHIVEKK